MGRSRGWCREDGIPLVTNGGPSETLFAIKGGFMDRTFFVEVSNIDCLLAEEELTELSWEKKDRIGVRLTGQNRFDQLPESRYEWI